MTKILNFVLKIKGGGREGGTCEVLRPCHPPKFGMSTYLEYLLISRKLQIIQAIAVCFWRQKYLFAHPVYEGLF